MKRNKWISLIVTIALVFCITACSSLPGGSSSIEVRFLLNDGTSDVFMVMKGKKGDTSVLPGSGPERRGYIFGGWYLDSGCKDEYKGAPEKSQSVYAKWTKAYHVAFVCEGVDARPVLVIDGGVISNAPAPAREGYLFDGWYKDLRYSRKWDLVADTVSGDMNLYARWIGEDSFTVTFDAAGGSDVAAIKGVPRDALISQPIAPKRSGFAFAGWYKDKEHKSQWEFPVDKVTKDITLYAKWDAEQVNPPASEAVYKVSFEANGGSAVAAINNVKQGATITKPADPVKTAYVFTGWYSDKATTKIWDFARSKVNGNLTLYAGWKGSTYTVIFNTNGGDAINPYIDVEHDAIISKPADPVRTGYVFDGWYSDSGFSYQWSFSNDKVSENITLYAKWRQSEQTSFTVTFNSNGGTTMPPYVNVQPNALIAQPTNPSRQGFSFGGWYTDSNYSRMWDFLSDRVGGNITLYARWLDGKITVRFDTNGGIPQPLDVTPNAGESIRLPGEVVMPGYSFAGWYTERNGGSYIGAAYDSYTPYASITLYAQWQSAQPVQVTVRYNTVGGEPQPLDKVVYVGDSIALPGAPVKPGRTFTGWYTQESGGARVGGAGEQYRPSNSITLYAQWQAISVTVRYDTGGGNPQPIDKTVTIGETITLPGPISLPDYIFNGWYTEKTGGAKVGSAGEIYAPLSSVTLYAQWIPALGPKL